MHIIRLQIHLSFRLIQQKTPLKESAISLIFLIPFSKKYPEVQELLKEHTGIWSIHKVSNTGFDLLFISRINENFTHTEAQSIVNDFMQKNS
jgi:hypothetical protein